MGQPLTYGSTLPCYMNTVSLCFSLIPHNGRCFQSWGLPVLKLARGMLGDREDQRQDLEIRQTPVLKPC